MVSLSKEAVEAHRKEAPDLLGAGTDFLTKSMGFLDEGFRARHPFATGARDAFQKFAHLLQSENGKSNGE